MDEPQRDPRLILDVARDRLSRQLSAADSLDGRAGVVFAVGSALAGILAGIVALKPIPNWQASSALGGAIGAYLALTVSLLYASWPREWADGPSALDVAADWDKSSDHAVAMRLARTLTEARDWNEEHVSRKVIGLRVNLCCLIALTAALLVLAWLVVPTTLHG
jgi:hypothetical protein